MTIEKISEIVPKVAATEAAKFNFGNYRILFVTTDQDERKAIGLALGSRNIYFAQGAREAYQMIGHRRNGNKFDYVVTRLALTRKQPGGEPLVRTILEQGILNPSRIAVMEDRLLCVDTSGITRRRFGELGVGILRQPTDRYQPDFIAGLQAHLLTANGSNGRS